MKISPLSIGAFLLLLSPAAIVVQAQEQKYEGDQPQPDLVEEEGEDGVYHGCNQNSNPCPADRWCDTFSLQCWYKRAEGAQCNENKKCLSENCRDNKCQATLRECEKDADCPHAEFCDIGGTDCCEDKLDILEPCERNAECESGFCDRNLFEDINTNNPDLCQSKRVNGDRCENKFECISNICDPVHFECTGEQSCANDSNCPTGEFCDANNNCADKFANGKPCETNNECDSGFCNTGLFEDQNTNNPDLCQAKIANGEACQADNDCVSNQCINFECSTKLPVGRQCEDNADCQSSVCSCHTDRCVAKLLKEGTECFKNCECKNGLYCDEGDEDHTNTCSQPEELSAHCHEDASCKSGNCDVFACPWGLCGTETCSPMLGKGAIGDYCVRNNMCASNRCRGPQGSRSCQAPNNRRQGNFGW